MEFVHKAEEVAGLVNLVAQLESEEGQAIQESFFVGRDESDTLSGIVDNMKNNGDVEGVAQTLWVLVRLCRRSMSKSTACAANLATIGSESCIQSILGCLKDKNKATLNNPSVALACSWLIMVLASDSLERIEALAAGGALDVLCFIMSNYKGSTDYPKVTEFATRACRNLGSHDETAKQLVEVGLCEHLVDIIKCYTDLLVTIDRQSPRTEHSALLVTSETDIDEGGGSSQLVAYEVVEAAMWAVLNMTCDTNIAQIFCSVQGLDAVLDCIRILSCVYAQREARAEATAAVDLSPESRDPELGYNPTPLPSESATAAACLVLRNLTCTGVYNFSLILHTPIIKVLFDCMKAYPLSFDVIDPCLFSVVNLAEEKTMAARLMEAELGPLLLRVASTLSINYRKITNVEIETRDQRHFRTGPISEAVIWIVNHLASQSKTYALQLGKMGFIDILASFMDEFKHKDGMVQTMCDALAAMCFTVRQTEEEVSQPVIRNITRLVESGALKTMIAALEEHKGPVASQLSEMHEPLMVLLAKTVEEFSRYASSNPGLNSTRSNSNSNTATETGNPTKSCIEKQGGGVEDAKSSTPLSRTASSSSSSNSSSSVDSVADAAADELSAEELSSAMRSVNSMRSRDHKYNVFVPIITTMTEHPTSGSIARCGCQLLLDLYYVSPEERAYLQDRNLVDPAYGKAAVGGETLAESMQAWGVEEILRVCGGAPLKKKKTHDNDKDDLNDNEKNNEDSGDKNRAGEAEEA